MSAENFYYNLKPYLPWGLRMALRRMWARRKRQASQDIWPINQAAGQAPKGWTGWPDGKKFAFVLTHDVEGTTGLAKCRRLMQLEMELGFRSSFNFIPEASYEVPRELREELVQNGFEVCVHDLHHDGKLFRTEQEFSGYSRQINRYLKEWNATGFRSAFMLRNLDWLHKLNIQYDSSTFDTDPFEPRPEGVGTVFPFWVERPNSEFQIPNFEIANRQSAIGNPGSVQPSVSSLQPSRSGYIELPYTLPQDSTLFLVLREKSSELWIKKLDWIVQQLGMALVNVHPDYLRFQGEPSTARTYPVKYYSDFLKHVRDRFAGLYWQPLPKAAAQWAAAVRPRRASRQRRRICMVTHSFYESDGRVSRYAETLAQRGDEVEVFALRRASKMAKEEVIGGVRLFRIQDRFGKREITKLSYLLPLVRFLLVSSWWMSLRHLRRRYDLVHVHNVPDFLVFAPWLPKLAGAKLILDIHDIVPEFYGSKFGSKASSRTMRALMAIERVSAGFADHVIMSNHLWHEKYSARTGSIGKCSVFINNVNARVFYLRPPRPADDKTIILFPGGLQWHQGLDIAIRAMPAVLKKMPAAEFHIHGDGNRKNELVALTHDLGLTDKVLFFDPRPVSEIAEVMSRADLGVVPKRADSFGNEAYSTKIMEFMSLGVPVVVSSTKIDRYYFNDSVVRFFESGNPDALAEAIVEVLQNDGLRRSMIANAFEYADRCSWQCRQADYLELVDALIENRPVTLDGNKPDAPSGNRNGCESQKIDAAARQGKETLVVG